LRTQKKYLFIYTISFIIIILFVFSYFWLNGKSLIWDKNGQGNGVEQHFNILVYFSQYLRDFFRNLIQNKTFELPMWNMNIGLGGDILTTFHYYVIGDPLNLLSVFVPVKYMEYLYQALIVLRIYLAGFGFLFYCFYMKRDGFSSVLGSFVYVFCSYSLYTSVRHPYFINPMIYLPLLLIGIEKIYKRKLPVLFIVMSAIAAISNFYFFYMICIMLFIYAVIRFKAYHNSFQVKLIIPELGRFIGYFLVSVSLAACFLLPNISELLNTSRFNADNEIHLLYPLKQYFKMCVSFISGNAGYWTCLGYTVLGVSALVMLFLKRKKHVDLAAAFLLGMILMCVPYLGHVMNGFSYVANRWNFGFGFVMAYLIVVMTPYILSGTVREKNIISGVLISFILLLGLDMYLYNSHKMLEIIIVVFMILYLQGGRIFEHNKYYIKAGYVTICLVSIAVSANELYAAKESNYTAQFPKQGEAIASLQESAERILGDYTEELAFHRYDYDKDNMQNAERNSSILHGVNGTAGYYSLVNGNISRFLEEMYLSEPFESLYVGLDSRTLLESVLGVKYYIRADGKNMITPYGYIQRETVYQDKKDYVYHLLENDYALPLVYTYDSYIDREQYEKMSVVEKQQAVLQGIVLEEPIKGLEKTDLAFENEKLAYTIDKTRHVELKENQFIVSKDKGYIDLVVQSKENGETYVIFENLSYQSEDNTGETFLTVKADTGISKKVSVYESSFNYYSGRHNFLCNLGYNTAAVNKIRISFRHKGIYSFDEINVEQQFFDSYEAHIQQRQEIDFQLSKSSANEIAGNISLDKKSIVTFAIPYSKGFFAVVNGEKQEILKGNTMFMALELEQGAYEIQLKYETPFLRVGFYITCAGIILLILIGIKYRKILE